MLYSFFAKEYQRIK